MECVKKCSSESITVQAVLKSFEPGKFLCMAHYDGVYTILITQFLLYIIFSFGKTDIYNNFDCLKKSREVTVKQCDNRKCADLSEAPTVLIQQSKNLIEYGEFEELKKLFMNNCEYDNLSSLSIAI